LTNFVTIAPSVGEPGGWWFAVSGLEAGACALERAGDRFEGGVEHLGYFACGESEDVAQDEDGELAGRQGLEGGDEGQGDGFGLLVAGFGAERHVDSPLHEGVGKWFEPYGLAEPGRLGRLDPGDVPLLGGSPTGRTKGVEASVGGDAVEPGAQRGPFLEPCEALPGAQQRVLQGVLGVLEGSEHPVAVHLQFSAVRFGQLLERLTVPGARP
jgi:hypothetical protein